MKDTQPAARWLPDFLLLSLLWGSSFLFLQKVSFAMGALPTSWMRVSIAALTTSPNWFTPSPEKWPPTEPLSACQAPTHGK